METSLARPLEGVKRQTNVMMLDMPADQWEYEYADLGGRDCIKPQSPWWVLAAIALNLVVPIVVKGHCCGIRTRLPVLFLSLILWPLRLCRVSEPRCFFGQCALHPYAWWTLVLPQLIAKYPNTMCQTGYARVIGAEWLCPHCSASGKVGDGEEFVKMNLRSAVVGCLRRIVELYRFNV